MTSTLGWTKDETDNLLELEYKEEIFQYMKQMEKETMAVPEHMDLQPELTWDLRPLLVDFLIEIHNHFSLQPESLYLAMNMMDRYLSKRVVYKKHYQLVGMTSLWISSKYEDSKERLPSVSQLCKLCSNTYDEAAFITMERHILKTLDYSLGHPTAEAFLKKDLEMSGENDQRLQHVAQFLMELTMFQRCFLSFGSSTIAASALFLARSICRKQIVMPTDPNVVACIQHLDNSLTNVSKTVHEKYSRSRFSQASIIVKEWVDNGGRALIQPISTECSNPLWTLSNMLWQPPSPIPTTFPTTQVGAGCQAEPQPAYSNPGYAAAVQQTYPQQSQQQPKQQQSGRHHSHSISSCHSQYMTGHQQRINSGSAHHMSYAALPQQPQPAVISHQTTYDIRPAGLDCGARWVDINMEA
ncbi:cyclin-like protein [Lobosporangium transversale]|uniref:Cyclin-like protein n=1 Tax=Lobosporangium transversale TaxID=64571 RepID=A0A1Y2GL44_9FUNG|nr:cyclin-like protein [Lobosporangium transversale]ORZ14393.1 cyclin-like protein [Lobosporangium transversale]|eukprot:XP_021880871.1 cyclin-like protein [Lobosporangium transversale]